MTKYFVVCCEYGQWPEDGTIIDAHDANEAARKWAKQYEIDNMQSLRVHAMNTPNDVWEITVDIELVPIYRAWASSCG